MTRPKHILIAERSVEVRDVLAEALEERGYRATKVDNADTLRQALESHETVDAVILDASSLGEDGRALEQLIKGLSLPLVIISGSPERINFALDRNLQLMSKPFTADELYAALDDAFASGEFGQRRG